MKPFDNVELHSGDPSVLGFSIQNNLCNFALFSTHAKKVFLGLFSPHTKTPSRIIPLNRTGDIWHIALENLPVGSLYAFQCRGVYNELTGDLFNPDQWLLDPYAKLIDSSAVWNAASPSFIPAIAKEISPFDWGDSPRPQIAKQDLVIYEMHVRGFTAHQSSKTTTFGTFAAMIEKIPYLKELGVNAVELMPIFEFDECHNKTIDPEMKERLPNYWGYNPISFFAVKQSYGTVTEFKTLVKELHKNGIEVILDVVYNHTGEGKEKDYAISLRGIDNQIYYMVGPVGIYRDYTGCGNTVNVNHPVVQHLILQSLRYWADEMQIDGFRFDLASILTRGTDGTPLDPSPILEAIAADPVLCKLTLIAEPWDAVGLYQIGSFSKWGPWMEWNDRFRNIARSFLKGTDDKAKNFASILLGSDFLYHRTNTPLSGINFITAHDGFSLRDLVSYQSKHNWSNGELNRDGAGLNENWNCGAEGITSDPDILQLRERQMRNHLLTLFLSQGVPMLLMGDEYGHTRHGNNNPYVQDNEINWFLWNELQTHHDIFCFVKNLIAFRKNHPELRKPTFLTNQDITWHGLQPNRPEWDEKSRFVAFSTHTSPKLFVAFNANYCSASVTLPSDTSWKLVVDTKDGWHQQYFLKPGNTLPSTVVLVPYSALIAKEIA